MKDKIQRVLDLACGNNKQRFSIGMDKRKLDGVDIVHDMEELPWPFEDEHFTRIIASHIVEHLKPWLMIDIMNEAWRVSQVGGQMLIVTPYAGSFGFYQDPTHIKAWNEATPLYFDPDKSPVLYGFYKPKPWKIMVNTWHTGGTLEVLLEKRDEKHEK